MKTKKSDLSEKQLRLWKQLRDVYGSDEKARKAFLYGGLVDLPQVLAELKAAQKR